ncbi:hypothetical protein A7M48_20685 [Acinetobacter baumannii]|nr:hypothetical protein A7M48_20685 [Acinetobacter baumannii]
MIAEFPEESRSDRMLFFQEAILGKFGFLPCDLAKKYSVGKDVSELTRSRWAFLITILLLQLPKEYQYVHCTGNMFALIR